MEDHIFRALEHEVAHLRQLRDTVLEILLDQRLTMEEKFRAIELVFEDERDSDAEIEEIRDRERLS